MWTSGPSGRLLTWTAWTSFLLSGDWPCLDLEIAAELQALRTWILGRVWPRRFLDLEDALQNFGRVLNDLLLTVRKHADQEGPMLRTRKFYKIREWDPERYHALLKEYEDHVGLLDDLVLELTRAANYVCDMVRRHIDTSFRMAEGVLLVEAGPFMDLTHKTYRPEYRGEERSGQPYPGLKEFDEVRRGRDFHFGREDEDDEE
jgi:hypothetical protein